MTVRTHDDPFDPGFDAADEFTDAAPARAAVRETQAPQDWAQAAVARMLAQAAQQQQQPQAQAPAPAAAAETPTLRRQAPAAEPHGYVDPFAFEPEPADPFGAEPQGFPQSAPAATAPLRAPEPAYAEVPQTYTQAEVMAAVAGAPVAPASAAPMLELPELPSALSSRSQARAQQPLADAPPVSFGTAAEAGFGHAAPAAASAAPMAPAPVSQTPLSQAHASPAAALAADPFAAFGEPAAPTYAPTLSTPAAPPPVAPVHEPEALRAEPAPLAFEAGADALSAVSVPRISIHAFLETGDVAEAMEKAAADRRLARASTEIKPGGLAAAVAAYQNQSTPQLIIVESHADAGLLLQQLEQLAEVCDPGCKVVVIGAANDIALYRALMRQGVSEYLTPPLTTPQLIRAVTALYADPEAPFVGRSISFLSAKGGAGSSTLAHNLGYALSETMQSQTVIVDFDLAFGTAGLDFNQDPLQGVADALGQPDRLDPVLLDRMMARCGERLSLFAAPATLDSDYEIAPEAFEEVASKIRTTAPFVILDLPHRWCGWMRRMILSSDEMVLVATPDLASLRNAKNIVDLVRQARPNDAPPRLVLNQVGMPGRPEIPLKDFAGALELEPAAVICFDAKLFGQAANHGQMLAEVAKKVSPKTKTIEALDALASSLARREAPAAPRAKSLTSLFKRK